MRAKDHVKAEKSSRDSPAGSGGGGEVAKLIKVVALGLLKQIAVGQQAQTTPVTSPVALPSPLSSPEWVPFEYDH
jgi:hypothetical protein